MTKSVLVIFENDLSGACKKHLQTLSRYDVVVAPIKLKQDIESLGLKWEPLEVFVESGSIYEASEFAEELSRLTLPDGTRISKSYVYKGYELWWIHYNSLFLYFCLPYTQYKKLLEYIKTFHNVSFYKPPHRSLFACYLKAYRCELSIINESGFKSPSFLPFGVLVQIIITILSVPILALHKRNVMVFTGDKFEKSRDYDFRMRFIYEELRQKDIPFVEFIRSLESWRTVIKHAIKRKRPVIYSEGVSFVARFLSVVSGGHYRAKKKFGAHTFNNETDIESRFKLLIATQYILGVYDDVWAIRIMKLILRAIGVKAALVSAAVDRNFHAVLGCKLNNVPIVGILHGVASRHYNVYDFLPGFDGVKMLSVDKYGLWSDWWKEYYLKNSKTYRPEQLYVSGPMRPLVRKDNNENQNQSTGDLIKVLFVSEQLAVPEEVLPYLKALLNEDGVSVYLTFRSYRDGFENWLKSNHPEILDNLGSDKILRSGINDAISKCDLVVGTHSTAVLEALFSLKPIVFFSTSKWGDYFDLKDYDPKYKFFAKNTKELMDCVRNSEKIPADILKKLQERFFGDPYQNGSKWMVEEAENILQKRV